MNKPLFVSSLGLIAGVYIGNQLGLFWWVWLVCSIVTVGLGGFLYYWRRTFVGVTLFISAFCFGAGYLAWIEGENVSRLTSPLSDALILGEVASLPLMDGDQLRFELKVDKIITAQQHLAMRDERMVLRFRLSTPEEKWQASKIQRGSPIRLSNVEIERPAPPRNPGAFDYRAYLHRQQIHWVGEVQGWRSVQEMGPPRGVLHDLDGLRHQLGNQIVTIFPPETAGLIRGMLLGERTEVPEMVKEDFREWGLIHLLAISGLHVGIFVTCVFGGATWLGITREKAAILSMALIPLYIILTGAGAPVLRAGVMACLGLLAILLRQWKDNLSFLGVAAWVLVLWNPTLPFEPGFQLSFGITCALLLAVQPLARLLPFPWPPLNQLLAVTFIAQVVSLPLLLVHFHSLPLFSWLVNLLAVPLISGIVIPFAYGALLLSLFHPLLAWVPAWFSSVLLSGIYQGLKLLTTWFRAEWHVGQPPVWWFILYGCGVIFLFWVWTSGVQRRRRLGLASVLVHIGILLSLSLFPYLLPREELRITFLDVGQGDCAVIETPNGQVILVDGGGAPTFATEKWKQRRAPFDVGEDVVVPFLRYRGIQSIDWLIMTHGDADHIEGLQAVTRKFPIKRVIRNPLSPHSSLEVGLMRELVRKRASVVIPTVTGPLALEKGIVWQFFHPIDGSRSGQAESPNENSVVFLLQAGKYRFLFTGDIGTETEKTILKKWEILPVDVLKVAHHGSRTSSGEAWVQALQPRVSIISVGKDNRYGHPVPEVIQRLEKVGSQIWRTDQSGGITIRVTSSHWQIEPTMQKPVP